MPRGMVHIPWYATFFRADRFARALQAAAEVAASYGATDYAVYRSRDDRYKFLHTVSFDSKLDWERYWNSQEMIDFREEFSGFYQVPVLYVWHDVITEDKNVTPAGAAAEAGENPDGEAAGDDQAAGAAAA